MALLFLQWQTDQGDQSPEPSHPESTISLRVRKTTGSLLSMVTLKFTSCVTLETVAIVALYHGCEKSCEGRPGYEAIAILRLVAI